MGKSYRRKSYRYRKNYRRKNKSIFGSLTRELIDFIKIAYREYKAGRKKKAFLRC